MINRQWIFARKPEGAVSLDTFELRRTTVLELQPGQVLVKVKALSVDPAQRAWMNVETYRAKLVEGEVMASYAIGEVVASASLELHPGDVVEGDLGWQDYATVRAGELVRRDANQKLEHLVGALSITGLTAYFGLLEIAAIRTGETVLISGAAGAVGCMAVQIARLAGCKVVAIAGGAQKCGWLLDELGVDAAVDYRSPEFRVELAAACNRGVDVYFDNVGGDILQSALRLMKPFGRIACCGAIAEYDQGSSARGPRGVPGIIVTKRLRMQGFIVFDHYHRRAQAEAAISGWLASGVLKAPTTVLEGLESAPCALIELLRGANSGKMMVKL